MNHMPVLYYWNVIRSLSCCFIFFSGYLFFSEWFLADRDGNKKCKKCTVVFAITVQLQGAKRRPKITWFVRPLAELLSLIRRLVLAWSGLFHCFFFHISYNAVLCEQRTTQNIFATHIFILPILQYQNLQFPAEWFIEK